MSTDSLGERALLQRFLAENEAACPRCGYALQRLSDDACPECGLQLALGLAAAAPRVGWWLAVVISSAMILGHVGLYTVLMLLAELLWQQWGYSPATMEGADALALSVVPWLIGAGVGGLLFRRWRGGRGWRSAPAAIGVGLASAVVVLLLVAAANPLRLGAYSGFFGFLLGEPMVTVSGGAALATLIVVLVRRQRWWQAPPGRNKVAGLLLVLLQVLMFLGYAVTAFLW